MPLASSPSICCPPWQPAAIARTICGTIRAVFWRLMSTATLTCALDFEIGPALLTWEGFYDVTTNTSDEIDVQLVEMFLTGDVSLPELSRLVNDVPAEGFITVEACYVGQAGGDGTCDAQPGTWDIHAEAEASAAYQLGGLTVKEILFDAAAAPDLFAGHFSALLEVPFGNYEDPLVVDIDAELGSHQMLATIVTTFDERYIGETLLWLEGFTLTTYVEAHFDEPSLQLDFTASADHAVLFVESPTDPGVVPEGVVTLTGLHAALSREGALDIRIDEAEAGFSAFQMAATGDPEAVEPAIHLVIGPNQAADDVVLAIHRAQLTFPALEKPLSLTANNMQFTRGGNFSMDEAELLASSGILDTLGLAGILPFDVTRIHVAGISNAPFTTQDFAATITIDGKFDFRYLADTPLENLQVTIGTQGPNAFSFTFVVANGEVNIQDTGPITVAISDMEFGPLAINTSLTVGAYVDGEFLDSDATTGLVFSGFFEALWSGEQASVGAGATVNEGHLDLLADSAHLAVNATFDVTFVHPDSPLTFEKLGLTFDLQLEVSKTFEILNLGLSVLNATADVVEIHFGDLFR